MPKQTRSQPPPAPPGRSLEGETRYTGRKVYNSTSVALTSPVLASSHINNYRNSNQSHTRLWVSVCRPETPACHSQHSTPTAESACVTHSKAQPTWTTYMCLCAALRALAALLMVSRTLVLVLADSRASRCISIVLSVPSICCSCLSYRFLRFKACRATVEVEMACLTFFSCKRKNLVKGNKKQINKKAHLDASSRAGPRVTTERLVRSSVRLMEEELLSKGGVTAQITTLG
ncbi:hypothetical protein E2C01_013113 [Portunus trituberculatus]|uniref:Uncharacterized protein n=1 Tax=Portunus trituberculatus TaxID=210409 RepID=A0A5B7DFD2_PORTR|nr:hypothetical protein [Portunus trituberculatus]